MYGMGAASAVGRAAMACWSRGLAQAARAAIAPAAAPTGGAGGAVARLMRAGRPLQGRVAVASASGARAPACGEAGFTTFASRAAVEGTAAEGTVAAPAAAAPMTSPLQRLPDAAVAGVVQAKQKINKHHKRRDMYVGMSKVVVRKIPMSPIKLNHWVKMLRRRTIEDALTQCRVTIKRARVFAIDALSQARANAVHNYGMDDSKLFVFEAYVGKGRYLKRVDIKAKGRQGIRHKKQCHLTVVLKERGPDDYVRDSTRVIPWTPGQSKHRIKEAKRQVAEAEIS